MLKKLPDWEKPALLLTAFLAILFLFLRSPVDPDLFWHLRYGEEILQTHQLSYKDQFSFTFTGYQAADSWWISEILIFYLVSKIGFFLTALFFAFLGAMAFLAVALWASLGKVNAGAVAISAFSGALVAAPVIGLRPQTISLFFFGLVFILLNQFWSLRRPKLIFLLPFIFLLWANTHAGFILGLILIWVFWLLELGRRLKQKFLKIPKIATPVLNNFQLKLLLVLNLSAFLMTFVNPYGAGLWRTVLNDAASSKIKNQIMEWASPNFRSELGIILLFYLLALVVLFYLGKMRIHPTRLLILLTFSFFALAAVRHLSFLALVATPLLAESLAAAPGKKVYFPYKNLALVLFLTLFTLGWAWQTLPQTYRDSRNVKNLAAAGNYPYEAVEYLKKHPPERMFNDYGWGGYLIWQLPQNKTFIDGRMPGWKKEGREILDDYDKIINLKKDFEENLTFWDIKTVLISTDSPLAQYLKIHPQWEKRYEDQVAVIFVHLFIRR